MGIGQIAGMISGFVLVIILVIFVILALAGGTIGAVGAIKRRFTSPRILPPKFTEPADPEARLRAVRKEIEICEWELAGAPMHSANYAAKALIRDRAEEEYLVKLIASRSKIS
jgi:hypothetical protein